MTHQINTKLKRKDVSLLDKQFLKRLENYSKPLFNKVTKKAYLNDTLSLIFKDRPETPTSIAYYSYKYFHDPHHLDLNKSTDLKLITILLASKYGYRIPELSDRVQLDKLFEQHHLYFERGMNHVITYNIFEGDIPYQIIPKKYIHTLPIKKDIKSVQLHENAGIFDMLTDKYPEQSFICTSGVINSAVSILIERLKQHHVDLSYSGDMDMNGLSIASRLLSIHPNIQLWHMNIDDFNQYSITTSKIKSRNKINSIKEPCLKRIADKILEEEKICYQEALFGKY